MKINSIKKKMNQIGIARALLYYLGRTCAKAEEAIIGRIVQKYGKVCEGRIVFKNRQMQDFTDNARAMFEYLIQNEFNNKYQIIWLVSEKKKFRKYKYKNVKFVTAENKYGWNSCSAYYYGNTAKYFFYTNNTANLNRYHCKGQMVINLWHGCGYKGATHANKNIPRSKTMEMFDYALVPGALFVESKSSYWECAKDKILPLGYPRYDWMLSPKNSKHRILSTLFNRRVGTTKLIIWLPTFRNNNLEGYTENAIEFKYELPTIEKQEDMLLLDSYCKKENILLIIKKHPLQIGWAEHEKTYQNIYYITDEQLISKDIQLYHLIGVCDALLSDYSSVAVDFLLLDRPIGFVLEDFELYSKTRGFIFESPLQFMPGEKIYNFHDLQKFFCNVSHGVDTCKKERQEAITVMHNRTENYCARIAEYFHL